uniref:Uncharacterized protein n=1 Tax=Anguilla anguilla TaxID=7936 RepID=A0A0E9WGN1_ANGAN
MSTSTTTLASPWELSATRSSPRGRLLKSRRCHVWGPPMSRTSTST